MGRPEVNIHDIRAYDTLWSFSRANDMRKQLREFGELFDSIETVKFLKNQRHKSQKPKIFTESSDIAHQETGLVQNVTEHENVADILGDEEEKTVSGITDYFDQGQTTLLPVDDFFLRPIEIASFDAALGATISQVYPIWDLYTINPSVRAKLRNYAYLSGDLHVRVAISGSPFHYGRLLLSYQPYPERNINIESYVSLIAALPAARINFLNYLSQAPGAKTMDIKSNKPVEMVCPFISTKPMHRLYNSSSGVISDVTSYSDLEEAGSLYVYSLNDVAAVDSAASPISVQIYAWMTNVQLGCPTATQVTITTESDEFDSGPVEKLATSAATWSDYLTAIPPIAPLAKASSMIFSGVAGVASWFGWSRPVITTEPTYVKNRPYCNGAQSIGSETAKRITYDPKQELTVDTRITGISDDELTIAGLGQREAFLTTFTWAPTDTKMASPIWLCKVHPQLDTITRGIIRDYYQPTPMSFAILPFHYWRGTIVYRFEIVCSAYHRGKIAVFFEPNIAQATLINSNISLNKNFMKIIDIQKTQSVEFCVEWAHPRAWALTMTAPSSIYNEKVFVAGTKSYEYVNGYIGVVPFTDIQSPDDSSVSVNVYVHAEGLMGNQLGDTQLPTERYITESGEYDDKSDELVSCVQLNETTASLDDISNFHFGEQPISLRGALKRFCYSGVGSTVAGGASENTLLVQAQIMPKPLPAYGAATPVFSLIGYMRYAFLGVRGGIRKRARIIYNGAATGALDRVSVTLGPVQNGATESVSWVNQIPVAELDGTVSFVPHTNGGVEFECPFYSSNLFAFSFTDDLIGTGNSTNDQITWWTKFYKMYLDGYDRTASTTTFSEESAAAEDFSFLRFSGAPFFSKNPIV